MCTHINVKGERGYFDTSFGNSQNLVSTSMMPTYLTQALQAILLPYHRLFRAGSVSFIGPFVQLHQSVTTSQPVVAQIAPMSQKAHDSTVSAFLA